MTELDSLIAEARADRRTYASQGNRIEAAASAIRESALLDAKRAVVFERDGRRLTDYEMRWRAYG
jgi:hypothetical protein